METRRANLKDARASRRRSSPSAPRRGTRSRGRLAERAQLLASVKDEIEQMQAEERRRQAELAAQARARLAAERLAAAAGACSDGAGPGDLHGAVDLGDTAIPVAPPPDGTQASQVISLAMQYLGMPYVWGGIEPVDRLRLLGPDLVRVRADRNLAAAPRGLAVELRHSRSPTRICSRAISSSSAGSATWGCTSAAASSSTRRTPATSSRSRASPATRASRRAPHPVATALDPSTRGRESSGVGRQASVSGLAPSWHASPLPVRDVSRVRPSCGSAAEMEHGAIVTGPYELYSSSISSAKCSLTARRRSLSVGVTSPSSIVKSRGRIAKRLTCSKRERSRFASSTTPWTSVADALVARERREVALDPVLGRPAAGSPPRPA